MKGLYFLVFTFLLSCTKNGGKQREVAIIDSTVYAVDDGYVGIVEIDTVYFDVEPFSRKVNKDDFSTNLNMLDSVVAYSLSEEKSLASLRLISKDVGQRNLAKIPIRLSGDYRVFPDSNDAQLYQIEFDEKEAYWYMSVLESSIDTGEGYHCKIAYSLTFNKEDYFLDGIVTSLHFYYVGSDKAEDWIRLTESDTSFLIIKEKWYFDNTEHSQINDYYRSLDSIVMRATINRKGYFNISTIDSTHHIVKNSDFN